MAAPKQNMFARTRKSVIRFASSVYPMLQNFPPGGRRRKRDNQFYWGPVETLLFGPPGSYIFASGNFVLLLPIEREKKNGITRSLEWSSFSRLSLDGSNLPRGLTYYGGHVLLLLWPHKKSNQRPTNRITTTRSTHILDQPEELWKWQDTEQNIQTPQKARRPYSREVRKGKRTHWSWSKTPSPSGRRASVANRNRKR